MLMDAAKRIPYALPLHASTGPVGAFLLLVIPDIFKRLSIHPEIRFAAPQHSVPGFLASARGSHDPIAVRDLSRWDLPFGSSTKPVRSHLSWHLPAGRVRIYPGSPTHYESPHEASYATDAAAGHLGAREVHAVEGHDSRFLGASICGATADFSTRRLIPYEVALAHQASHSSRTRSAISRPGISRSHSTWGVI